MLQLNWAYALLSLVVVPFMAFATVWFSSEARKAFRKSRKEIGNVNAELEESIAGVRESQAFSREEANIENFRQSNAANRDANLKAVAYTSALAPTLEALGYVAIAFVAGVGGILLLTGQTLGGYVIDAGPHRHLHRLCPALQPAHLPDCRAVDQHPERHRRRRAHLRASGRAARHRREVRRRLPMPAITGRVVFQQRQRRVQERRAGAPRGEPGRRAGTDHRHRRPHGRRQDAPW